MVLVELGLEEVVVVLSVAGHV
jgi:hypothetical protein